MDNTQKQSCRVGAICTNDAQVIVYPSLAMVYIPNQEFRELYDADTGLSRGTIFRELDKPFVGRGGCSPQNNYRVNGGRRR